MASRKHNRKVRNQNANATPGVAELGEYEHGADISVELGDETTNAVNFAYKNITNSNMSTARRALNFFIAATAVIDSAGENVEDVRCGFRT